VLPNCVSVSGTLKQPLRSASAPHFVDGRVRAPATVSAIPPAISTWTSLQDSPEP